MTAHVDAVCFLRLKIGTIRKRMMHLGGALMTKAQQRCPLEHRLPRSRWPATPATLAQSLDLLSAPDMAVAHMFAGHVMPGPICQTAADDSHGARGARSQPRRAEAVWPIARARHAISINGGCLRGGEMAHVHLPGCSVVCAIEDAAAMIGWRTLYDSSSPALAR